MVEAAEAWRWSSAGAHYGLACPDPILDMERWRKRWTPAEWHQFLSDGESAADVSALRQPRIPGVRWAVRNSWPLWRKRCHVHSSQVKVVGPGNRRRI